MGKKSKAARAKAKASAVDGSSGTNGGSGAAGGGAADSVVVTSSNSKKQKCVRCFGTVKAAKGTACPGCSLLYCWRCEKKAFEMCPNGSSCIHPVRRCQLCAGGHTMLRVLEEKEGVNYLGSEPDHTAFANAYSRFQQYMERDDALSLEANFFVRCTDCAARECFRCNSDSVPRHILSCGSCDVCQCVACSKENFLEVNKSPDFVELFGSHMGTFGRGMPQDSQVVEELGDLIRRDVVGGILICSTCNDCICATCLDDRSMKSLVEGITSICPRDGLVKARFKCSRCYWSTKPCTNPSCPNEVGVPTKRCGDCHIDRYCSVECQMAAYPDHIARCKTIVARRNAAVSVATEKSGDGEMK